MIKKFPFSAQKFQQQVLAWFDLKGRKHLPWQLDTSPYRVWISEVMLQQTQVTTVMPYFVRFLEYFPDINTLANALEDEVLHLWTGLGYYSRARNLHRTAKLVKQMSSFPNQLSDLLNLPGIGRSTAGAILAIAFEKRAAILDGNVKRLLTRLNGITEWPGERTTLTYLWNLSEELTPEKRVADYTQAMMDLGATLCTRGKPKCGECPFEKTCIARIQGVEQSIPLSKPKPKLPVRMATFFIFQNSHYVLLEKRPAEGVWRSLWSLPEAANILSLAEIKQYCKKFPPLNPNKITLQNTFRHTFSHFHLDILPVFIPVPSKTILKTDQQIWYDLLKPPRIGLPGPVKKILSGLNIKNS